MEELFNWAKENLPVWAVLIILGIIGFVRYGPKFFKEMLEIGESYQEKNETVRKEMIQLLKEQVKTLQYQLKAEKEDKKILHAQIKRLNDQINNSPNNQG